MSFEEKIQELINQNSGSSSYSRGIIEGLNKALEAYNSIPLSLGSAGILIPAPVFIGAETVKISSVSTHTPKLSNSANLYSKLFSGIDYTQLIKYVDIGLNRIKPNDYYLVTFGLDDVRLKFKFDLFPNSDVIIEYY